LCGPADEFDRSFHRAWCSRHWFGSCVEDVAAAVDRVKGKIPVASAREITLTVDTKQTT
jgi:hypothetical protein